MPDPTPQPQPQTPAVTVINVYQEARPDCCPDCSGTRPRRPIRFFPH